LNIATVEREGKNRSSFEMEEKQTRNLTSWFAVDLIYIERIGKKETAKKSKRKETK